MKSNVGKTDSNVRLFVGVVVAVLGIYFSSWWGLFSIVLFATAYWKICPLYSLLGINTCSTKIKVR